MNGLALWCIGTLLLVLSNITYAQAYPCSGPGPGEVVVGQTPASNGVASMPLCQRVDQGDTASQAPPEKWESRWGAIAVDTVNGVIGSVTGMQGQEQARQGAIIDCRTKGGADCKLALSFSNGCGVMALGDTIYQVEGGATVDEAVKKSMRECKASSPNCHVRYTICSPAVRIQ